ncbi:DUF4845 domain-containing protein [Neisseriaceae bacterium TC5R-5]|nr:DUF4845 domain-containing protein [Neisseriaceae bacterium TC5R-5]
MQNKKRQHQQGLSLLSVLLTLAMMAVIGMLLIKILPVYSEYAEIKQILNTLSTQNSLGELGIRKSFNERAGIADVTSVRGENLTVVTGSDFVFIHAIYQREVPLFANVSLLFKFDTQAGKNPATTTS